MNEQEIKSLLENVALSDIKNCVEYLKIQHAENQAVAQGKSQKEIIKIFLDERRKTSLRLAPKYPENTMGKNMDNCYAYIMDNAKKAANGAHMATITSFTVFDWAVNYFCDDSIPKFETAKAKTTAPTGKPIAKKETTLEELMQEKEEWQKDNDQDVANWEIENNKKIDEFDKKYAMDFFPPENPHRNAVNPYLNKVFPRQAELDKMLAEKSNN